MIPMLDRDDDPREATIRRLPAELLPAQEEGDELTRRLAYAEEIIRELRTKVVGNVNQAAAPQ